ncbi:hypothetical protein BGZ94_001791, partial [Podila epigama]
MDNQGTIAPFGQSAPGLTPGYVVAQSVLPETVVQQQQPNTGAIEAATAAETAETATTAAVTTETLTPTVPATAPTITFPLPPTQRPHWATGDPFFDTMAGMEDSSEYQQYLNQIQGTSLDQQQPLNLDQATSMTSTAAALANGSVAAANTGLDHWNRTREAWTKGRWQVVESENSKNPALAALSNPSHRDAIYDSLVYDRKRLAKPIPLPLVIKVLVSGWKRDGLWQESPSQTPP